MESVARARGLDLQALSADAWEELWRAAKKDGVPGGNLKNLRGYASPAALLRNTFRGSDTRKVVPTSRLCSSKVASKELAQAFDDRKPDSLAMRDPYGRCDALRIRSSRTLHLRNRPRLTVDSMRFTRSLLKRLRNRSRGGLRDPWSRIRDRDLPTRPLGGAVDLPLGTVTPPSRVYRRAFNSRFCANAHGFIAIPFHFEHAGSGGVQKEIALGCKRTQ